MRTIPAAMRSDSSSGTLSRLFAALRAPSNLLRIRRGWKGLAVGLVGTITFVGVAGSPAFAATPLNLGYAAPFAVLAYSTVTNTGPSVITGDVGLSPGTAIVGFPPGTFASGTTYAADALAGEAQASATTAYGVAASETPSFTAPPAVVYQIGGTTLTPGVYRAASGIGLTGTVTLNGGGDPNAVFIFQAGSTLITASNSTVFLEDGAQPCNVFWQVGSAATIGTGTTFVGTILAYALVAMATGATSDGGLFSQTAAVTLDDNVVTTAACATPPAPTTPAAPTATTTTTTTTATTTTTVPVSPVTTTTTPKGGVHPVSKGGTTTTTSGSSTTIVPVGAPATGEGGTAGSGFSPLGLIGLGAVATSAGAGSIALRLRRRRR